MKNTRKSPLHLWNAARVLLGVMVFTICIFAFSLDALAAEGTVKTTSGKIRSEANTSSAVLASVGKGDELSIKGKVTGADGYVWYQVFVDADTLGYIRSDLLDVEGTVPDVSSSTSNSSQDTNNNQQTSTPQIETVTTVVEPMASQSATITGGDVNVRAGASTSTDKVTKATNGMAVTVTGQATGTDGKVWYQVKFMSGNSEVTGFIRSDYIQLGEVIEQPTVEPETEVQEPETQPEEEPVVQEQKAFETVLETTAEGTQEWYLYDNGAGYKYSIPKLMEATQNNQNVADTQAKQVQQQKIVIIVLVVIIIVLILGITLLIFKMHDNDSYYEDNEPEDYPVRRRPERTQGQPVRRPANGQGRPAQGSRPSQGNRPQGGRPSQGNRPSQGSRPVQAGRPSGEGRPTATGRPVRSADVDLSRRSGAEPVRRVSAQPTRPTAQTGNAGMSIPAMDVMPMNEVTYEEEPTLNVNKNAQWHSKNFLADDDEFEFEFLNMDDPSKL